MCGSIGNEWPIWIDKVSVETESYDEDSDGQQ